MQDNSILTYVTVVTIIFLLMAGSLMLFTITYVKRQIKHRKDVEEMRRKNEASLLKATLATQEKERERIGANLHDDIGPLLSSLKMYFKNELNSEYRNDKDELNEIISVIDENIEQVRDISRDLVPNVLKQFGLISAVEELKRRIEKVSDVQIDIFPDKAITISTEESLSIYRIIQEAINNAIRHGKADHLNINFKSNNGFKVEIIDNGGGFDTTKNITGLGLRNIEARSKAIDSLLTVKSQEGKGTTITIERKENEMKSN